MRGSKRQTLSLLEMEKNVRIKDDYLLLIKTKKLDGLVVPPFFEKPPKWLQPMVSWYLVAPFKAARLDTELSGGNPSNH